MFEKAARLKIRFNTEKGVLSVEDLYDKSMPLTSNTGKVNLDSIAQELDKQLKTNDTVSFVNPGKVSDDITQLKLDLVKHIINVRLKEREEANKEQNNALQRQRILGLIAKKQDESLESMSEEELQAMLKTLD